MNRRAWSRALLLIATVLAIGSGLAVWKTYFRPAAEAELSTQPEHVEAVTPAA